MKSHIPEILDNQCANCDNDQKERAGKIFTHMQEKFPVEWERAVRKFRVS